MIYRVLLLIFTIICINNAQSHKRIKLFIELPKKEFLSTEDIALKITIQNDSDECVLIPLSFLPEYGYIWFEIIDSDGNKSKYAGEEYKIEQNKDYCIPIICPGESFSHKMNLKKFYKLEKENYTIIAFYDCSSINKKDVCCYYLSSNKIKFKIK